MDTIKNTQQFTPEFPETPAEINVIYATLPETCSRGKTAREVMNTWTDAQLYCFIVVDTVNYGRPLHKAIENARYHICDREAAIKAFSTRDVEDMIFIPA